MNPMLPDWREELRRCRHEHSMPGIRLHPNFHGYRLDDAVFAELLAESSRQGLIVQVAPRMDDIRVQHPLIKVPDVDPVPLLHVLSALPRAPLVVLNASRTDSAPSLRKLAALPGVNFDCAMWEARGHCRMDRGDIGRASAFRVALASLPLGVVAPEAPRVGIDRCASRRHPRGERAWVAAIGSQIIPRWSTRGDLIPSSI